MTTTETDRVERQAIETLKRHPTAKLVELFEHSDRQMDAARRAGDSDTRIAIARVRGWIMEALEAHDGDAFDRWIESPTDTDESPRAYFLPAA